MSNKRFVTARYSYFKHHRSLAGVWRLAKQYVLDQVGVYQYVNTDVLAMLHVWPDTYSFND